MKLVLVHLGNANAGHLWKNLDSLLSKFNSLEVVLVFDHLANLPTPKSRVEYFEYVQTEQIKRAFEKIGFDLRFREGFWQLTLERLFALQQYHETNPDTPILHIESDVLLFPDFPFEVFSSTKKLSWLRVDDDRDVATILFSPNSEETNWLGEEVLCCLSADPLITDMKALNRIRKMNEDRIQTAPSFSSLLAKEINWKGANSKKLVRQLSENSALYNGIFDPAAIGMWLSGSDPRNYYGVRRIFDTEEILLGGTYVDPSNLEYRLTKEGSLLCSSGGAWIQIWCLHVHSKDIRLFSSGWEKRLEKLIQTSKLGKIHKEFDLACLVKLILANMKNHTLIGFVLHMKGLWWLKRILVGGRSIIRRRFQS
jgi:hypothetical protein